MIEHKAWPKTPRLFRDMTITEKLDGTNSAIIIERQPFGDGLTDDAITSVRLDDGRFGETGLPRHEYIVGAQSRNRLLQPGRDTDNYGFAAWVEHNCIALVRALGEGRHYGEWWGGGIARGYGLHKDDKRFSLFNVKRYLETDFTALPNVRTVPVLYRGMFDTDEIRRVMRDLRDNGSVAVVGFPQPEGVIVWHEAANQLFKAHLIHSNLSGDKA